ncbi:MAG: hypothetical protein JSS32_04520 [Verrucomicrobia bacterium]|nr:hypothetical protein [Verrucomicrobiota bacterium]
MSITSVSPQVYSLSKETLDSVLAKSPEELNENKDAIIKGIVPFSPGDVLTTSSSRVNHQGRTFNSWQVTLIKVTNNIVNLDSKVTFRVNDKFESGRSGFETATVLKAGRAAVIGLAHNYTVNVDILVDHVIPNANQNQVHQTFKSNWSVPAIEESGIRMNSFKLAELCQASQLEEHELPSTCSVM